MPRSAKASFSRLATQNNTGLNLHGMKGGEEFGESGETEIKREKKRQVGLNGRHMEIWRRKIGNEGGMLVGRLR